MLLRGGEGRSLSLSDVSLPVFFVLPKAQAFCLTFFEAARDIVQRSTDVLWQNQLTMNKRFINNMGCAAKDIS